MIIKVLFFETYSDQSNSSKEDYDYRVYISSH